MIARLHASLRVGLLLLIAARPASLPAQHASPASDSVAADAPIRDNSFLVEEAYNQDPGTVQHINAFTRDPDGGWTYSLTEEWAVRGQHHQVGATLPFAHVAGDSASAWGLGDVAINYRYQLAGVDGGRLAVAPRFSVFVPTGSATRGLGAGVASLQLALPVSIDLGALVTHLNAGVTRVGARGRGAGAESPTTIYALGESVVWLAARRVNLLLESVWSSAERVDETGTRVRERTLVVSPGVRWAHDLPRGLQVVPGVAVPFGVGPSRGDRSLFLYLSLEHPY